MLRFNRLFSIFLLSLLLGFSCSKKNVVEPDPNSNPVVSSVVASPQMLAPGQTATISVTANDADGDNLSYSFTATGGSVTGNGATATFTAGSNPGSASVAVNVSDGNGGVATGSTPLSIVLDDPTIDVSAQVVQTTTGEDCLLFFGIPRENVLLISVKFTNPLGQNITYDLGNRSYPANNPTPLQESGLCYTKLSGTYTFEFSGSRPGGGSFTAMTTYQQQ